MTTTPHPEDMPEAIKAYEDRYQCSAEDPMCQADLGFFLAGWSASASLAEQRTRAMREALQAILDDLEIGAHPHLHIQQIRAALSDQSAPGNGEGDAWQPIETAPKDGTHILVSWPMRKMDDDGMPTGEITRRDTLVTWMNGSAWIEPDYLGASGEWYGDDDCYAVDPDFWQPLPSAPAQSGGQGK